MSRSRDFWSRRKAAVRAEQEAAQEAAPVRATPQEVREEPEQERSDAELLAEAGLEEPESYQSAEELRKFLHSALPQRFKTRALRHMWRLNPVLANLDGLVDYDDDYTDAARVSDTMKTVYKAGRGMFDRIAALEAARDQRAAAALSDAPGADVADVPDQVLALNSGEISGDSGGSINSLDRIKTPTHSHATDQSGDAPDELWAGDVDSDAPEQVPEPQLRRMRFRFD